MSSGVTIAIWQRMPADEKYRRAWIKREMTAFLKKFGHKSYKAHWLKNVPKLIKIFEKYVYRHAESLADYARISMFNSHLTKFFDGPEKNFALLMLKP